MLLWIQVDGSVQNYRDPELSWRESESLSILMKQSAPFQDPEGHTISPFDHAHIRLKRETGTGHAVVKYS